MIFLISKSDIIFLTVAIKQSQFYAVFLLILSGQAKDYFVLCIIKLLYSIIEAGNH